MRKVKIKFIPISHIRDFLYTAEIFAFVTFGEASVYNSVDYFYFAKNIVGLVLLTLLSSFDFGDKETVTIRNIIGISNIRANQ